MFSSEWSAALSSLLPQYSYISTSVAQSRVNQSHRYQQMSQPAEVAERGFCLFVICHSRDTSLKSPPASDLDCLCCALGDFAKRTWYFCKCIKTAGWARCVSLHLVFAAALPLRKQKQFLVVRQNNNNKKRPGVWGLMLPSTEGHLFPLAPSGCGAALELAGWGPGTVELGGAGQCSKGCNAVAWECSCSHFSVSSPLHFTCHPIAECVSALPENSKCTCSGERLPGCTSGLCKLCF